MVTLGDQNGGEQFLYAAYPVSRLQAERCSRITPARGVGLFPEDSTEASVPLPDLPGAVLCPNRSAAPEDGIARPLGLAPGTGPPAGDHWLPAARFPLERVSRRSVSDSCSGANCPAAPHRYGRNSRVQYARNPVCAISANMFV
jgi:hypothetical protein